MHFLTCLLFISLFFGSFMRQGSFLSYSLQCTQHLVHKRSSSIFFWMKEIFNMKFPTLFSTVTVHNSRFGFPLSTTMCNLQGRNWPSVCRLLRNTWKLWTPNAPPLRRPSRGSRMRLRTSCSTWRGPMLPARLSIRSRGTLTRWLSLYKLHPRFINT